MISFLSSTFLTVFIASYVNAQFPLLWLMASYCSIIFSYWTLNKFQTSESHKSISKWRNLTFSGSIISGIIWGVGSIFVYTNLGEPYKALSSFIIGGTVAANMLTSSALLRSFYGYLIPATLPLLYAMFLSHNGMHHLLALMLIGFCIIITLIAHNSFKMLRKSLILNEKNKKLISKLTNSIQNETGANQAKTQFLAKMSHELRTPLNAIIGFSEIMKDETFGPIGMPKYKEYCADINMSAHHLLGLINNILDLSKIESGKQQLIETSVDTYNSLEDCIALLNKEIDKKSIYINRNYDENLPLLCCDELKFKQVVINILSNALKFSEIDGQIDINMFTDRDNNFIIQIKDYGIGMNPKDIPSSFKEYYRVNHKKHPHIPGSGLGLAVTKGLMKLHGGSLWIDSNENEGACVTITFPEYRIIKLDVCIDFEAA